jgi:Concanavalin A-like lectin/glucanases superfamily
MIDKRQISPYRGYSFYLYNGRPGVQLADAGANGGYGNYIATPTVPTDGKWHLVAVSVSRAGSASFFVDKSLIGTFNVSQRSGSLENPSPLRIGSQSFSVSSLFRGAIDEVAVFRGALTIPEIEALFNAGAVGMCRPQL